MFSLRNLYGRPRPVATSMNRIPLVLLFGVAAAVIMADLILDIGLNWIDYILIGIIALFGLKGYLKGLVNTVFSFVGYFLSLIVAVIFSPKLSLLVMANTPLGKTISEKLNEAVPALSAINAIKIDQAKSAAEMINNNPELLNAFSDNPLLGQLISITAKASDTSAMYEANVITVNDFIVYSLLKVIALVVLFIFAKLIAVIIAKLLTSVLNASAVLGTANRTFGMLIGLAAGVLICYVLFILLIPAVGSLNIIRIPEAYTKSAILNWSNTFIISLGQDGKILP